MAVALLGGLVYTADYIDRTRVYSLEDMSAFLAVCGDYVQTEFTSYKPGFWDYLLVLVCVVVVIYTLYYSVKYMIKPNESNQHIKYRILHTHEENS